MSRFGSGTCISSLTSPNIRIRSWSRSGRIGACDFTAWPISPASTFSLSGCAGRPGGGWSLLCGDAISDYVVWVAMAGVILGGRLGYCLLYAPRQTFTDPVYFFTVWKGGMASHGGILGVILVMIFYARAHKIPFYNLADATAFCVPICLGLGRCANFLNGELWGRPTDAWWGVVFPDAPLVHGLQVPRYPSQLIEALLEGLLLQLVLIAVRFSTKREGAVALTFMAGYAVLRIVGEQFRAARCGHQLLVWIRHAGPAFIGLDARHHGHSDLETVFLATRDRFGARLRIDSFNQEDHERSRFCSRRLP